MAMTTITGSIKGFTQGVDVPAGSSALAVVGRDATDHYSADAAGSGKIVVRLNGANYCVIGLDAAAVASLIAALQAL